MSFERNRFGFNGEISFECYGCGSEHHSEISNFSAALENAKEFGWVFKKDGSAWLHFCCSTCAQED